MILDITQAELIAYEGDLIEIHGGIYPVAHIVAIVGTESFIINYQFTCKEGYFYSDFETYIYALEQAEAVVKKIKQHGFIDTTHWTKL